MSAALHDLDRVVRDAVNQTVLLVDATAPVPGVIPNQRFRAPDAVMAVTLDIRDQLIDTTEGFLVLLKPIEIIFPGLFMPLLFRLPSFAVNKLVRHAFPCLHVMDCLQKQRLVVLVVKRIARELFYTPIQVHPYGRLNGHHVYHHPHKIYLNALSLVSRGPCNATGAR